MNNPITIKDLKKEIRFARKLIEQANRYRAYKAVVTKDLKIMDWSVLPSNDNKPQLQPVA